jgi:hypothetical protein
LELTNGHNIPVLHYIRLVRLSGTNTLTY